MFPWQGQYHLFYLGTQQHLWDHVGHAVSDDLIRWSTQGLWERRETNEVF